MKLASMFLAVAMVLALVVMLAPVAKADGVPPGDPQIGLGGAIFDAPVGIITTDFTVSPESGSTAPPCVVTQFGGASVQTSPQCQLLNAIQNDGVGEFIDSISFDVSSVPYDPSMDTCAFSVADTVGNLFDSCSVTPDGSGGTVYSFSGGTLADTLYGGIIPNGTVFSVTFTGISGTAGVSAQLPEPGTFSLLLVALVGLIGIGLKRSPLRT
jgi:hypothetical protein